MACISRMYEFIILVVLFTLLLNVSILSGRGNLSGLFIGFVWIVLLGLLALAAVQTKNIWLRIASLALISFCLAYPYLGGFADKARLLSWVSLLASLSLTLGFLVSDEPDNAKLLVPLDLWLLFVVIFLV
jgi:hypothetical protein